MHKNCPKSYCLWHLFIKALKSVFPGSVERLQHFAVRCSTLNFWVENPDYAALCNRESLSLYSDKFQFRCWSERRVWRPTMTQVELVNGCETRSASTGHRAPFFSAVPPPRNNIHGCTAAFFGRKRHKTEDKELEKYKNKILGRDFWKLRTQNKPGPFQRWDHFPQR